MRCQCTPNCHKLVMGRRKRFAQGHTFRRDFAGKKINHWLILRPDYRNSTSTKTKWMMRCDCGRVYSQCLFNVTSGKSKGCWKCFTENCSLNLNPAWKGSKDIPKAYISNLAWGAKQRGIKFSITLYHLQKKWDASGGICSLSGMPMAIGATASLDRINSDKAYVPSNVQWVHKMVNRMKNSYGEKEFIEACCRIADFQRRPK